LDYRHPIVQSFRGRGQAGLLTTPVFKHWKLVLPKVGRAKTVLATGSGDPLIVEEPTGRGRVVLVATSADPSWTAMPLWPSFVPLVQEIVAWCAAGQLQQRNVLAGEPLDALVSSAGMTAVSVQSPDGRKRPAQLHAAGDRFALTYADTSQSGIYEATFGPPTNRSQTFAVNVDTAESDLTQVDPEDLRNETWPNIPFIYRTSWQDIKGTAVGAALAKHALHVDLLYVVLGLLFAESFLGWKMGAKG
jgi:hypothetical protein